MLRHDVNEIVRDWAGSLTRDEALERCFATGAPAGLLNTIADIFGDRQFHARRTIVAVDEEQLGETLMMVPGVIPHLSETPGEIRHLGPRLGQPKEEILKEILELDPDESYVVFGSFRKDSIGSADLYVSFRDGDTWTAAVNLGSPVNSKAFEFCPIVSPDGRYLYLTSERMLPRSGERLDQAGLEALLRSPLNGGGNVYRVSLSELPAMKR